VAFAGRKPADPSARPIAFSISFDAPDALTARPPALDAPRRRIVRFVLLAGSLRGDDMRLMGGGPYRCALCGAVLNLPFDATPKVKIAAASGRPTWRILSIGHEEVHRCEMSTTRSEPAEA